MEPLEEHVVHHVQRRQNEVVDKQRNDGKHLPAIVVGHIALQGDLDAHQGERVHLVQLERDEECCAHQADRDEC